MPRFGFLPVAATISILMSGCATNQNSDFRPYISPLKYANDDCHSLAEKAEVIDAEIRKLYPSAGPRVGQNTVAVGVGLFVFWPALFLIADTDGASSLALTQLKGEVNAISNAAAQNNCDFVQRR